MEKEWHRLISFNGSQANAFEELVCQVAMNEENVSFQEFERVGTPDGGVECYWRLTDNAEWGWQAKYYENLNSGEWNNIKKSLFDTVYTHPALSKYYICIPHNLSDGRRGKRTQKATWEGYKATWTNELFSKGKDVQLILWNSSTLLSRLILAKNVGISSFFFGSIDIKEEKLSLLVDSAIENLGPKYSPDLNFELDYLPTVFDALSKNQQFQQRFKHRLDPLLQKFNKIISDTDRFDETKLLKSPLKEKYDDLVRLFQQSDFTPVGTIPVKDYITAIKTIKDVIAKLKDAYFAIESKYQEDLRIKAEKENKLQDYRRYSSQKTGSANDNIYHFVNVVDEMVDYLNGPALRAANEGVLFLKGMPGMGKSHLLADIALKRRSSHIPSVFLLGEHFPNHLPKLFIQQTLCPNISLDEYLKALESLARSRNERLLFIIDAINEGNGKYIWKSSIAGLVKELKHFRWIGFVFSYRTTFEDVLIPEGFDPPTVVHAGFEGMEYEATKEFFKYYKIQQPAIPLLNPEFSNPLFLKTFCVTLNKAGKTTIPEGYEGVSKILEEYLLAVNKNIGHRLEYNHKKLNLVQRAVEELIRHQISSGDFIVSWDLAYKIVEPLLKTYSNKIGFLEELIKEGLLIEDYYYNSATDKHDGHGIVFNYERFNEHLKATYLLKEYTTSAKVKNAFGTKGRLRALFIDKLGFTGLHRGLLNAFAIIIPEKFKLEIYQVLIVKKNGYAEKVIFDAFLQSLIWRKHDSITSDSRKYVVKQLNDSDDNVTDFFNTILLVNANPTHYYNADFIHNLLKDRQVGERDYLWSIRIDRVWSWYEKNSVQRIIDWCWSSEEKSYVKDDSIALLGKTLAWLFTNSNRNVRDKATKAFASLFSDRIHLLKDLIAEFKNVNDPYVLERIMAGTLGAVVHSNNDSENAILGQYIYNDFFRNRKPPLNILTRDYAKGIIEYLASRKANLDFKKTNLYPPFDYEFPTNFPDDEWVASKEIKKEGTYTNEEYAQSQVLTSVLHWDFARYILGTNHGSSIPFTSYTMKSKASYDRLHKKLRGDKRRFLDIYVNSTAMLNADSDHGKSIRRAFHEDELDTQLEIIKGFSATAWTYLENNLSSKDWRLFKDAKDFIDAAFETDRFDRKRFPVKLVQHYIIKKVFDLGWRMDYFGKYDSGNDDRFRKAGKPERIGKKYQWIGYHEIMALLSDNYIFFDRYNDRDLPFKGGWQHYLRDIDPTVLTRKQFGDNELNDNTPASKWWINQSYTNWDEDRSTWLKRFDDMPDFTKMISVADQVGDQWYLMYDRIVWSSEKPLGKDRYKAGRKELWVDINAFIVNKQTKAALFHAGDQKLFWIDQEAPKNSDLYNIFLGEWYYSDAYKSQVMDYFEKYPFNSFSLRDRREKIILTAEEYSYSSEYDLSGEKTRIFRPTKFLFELIGGRTGKHDGFIYDKEGNIIAMDAGTYSNKPDRCLLVRKKTLDECLKKKGLELIWFFCGEKEDIGADISFVYRMSYSGFIASNKGKIEVNYYHKLDR